MLINFPGLPDEIGDYIKFPTETELLNQPMFSNATLDYFMEHATPFQRSLINQMPLRCNTKHAYVSCVVRITFPGFLINKIVMPELGSTRNEWHPDGIRDNNRVVHSITNFLSTEFNDRPFSLDLPDGEGERWVMEQILKREKELGIISEILPTNRIVTYTNHIHRAPIPVEQGVRFFLRVQETDVNFNATNLRSTGSSIWQGTREIKNVAQRDGQVTIFYP